MKKCKKASKSSAKIKKYQLGGVQPIDNPYGFQALQSSKGYRLNSSTLPSGQQVMPGIQSAPKGFFGNSGQVGSIGGNAIGALTTSIQQPSNTGEKVTDAVGNVAMGINPIVGAAFKIGNMASGIQNKRAAQVDNQWTGEMAVSDSNAVSKNMSAQFFNPLGTGIDSVKEGKTVAEKIGGFLPGTPMGVLSARAQRKRAKEKALLDAEIKANTARDNTYDSQSYVMAKKGAVIGSANAELESGEPFMNPDGNMSMVPKSAPSHDEGGVKMKLDPGTMVLGDMTIPGTSTTFKQEGERIYKDVAKWENRFKTANNETSKATATRMIDALQERFAELTRKQESLKSSAESQSSEIPKFKTGGEVDEPKDSTQYDITALQGKKVELTKRKLSELVKGLPAKIASGDVNFAVDANGKYAIPLRTLVGDDKKYESLIGGGVNSHGVNGYIYLNDKELNDLSRNIQDDSYVYKNVELLPAASVSGPIAGSKVTSTRGNTSAPNANIEKVRSQGAVTDYIHKAVQTFASNNPQSLGAPVLMNGKQMIPVKAADIPGFEPNAKKGVTYYIDPTNPSRIDFTMGTSQARIKPRNQIRVPDVKGITLPQDVLRVQRGNTNTPGVSKTTSSNDAKSTLSNAGQPVNNQTSIPQQQSGISAYSQQPAASNVAQQPSRGTTPPNTPPSLPQFGGASVGNLRTGNGILDAARWADPAMMYNLGMGLFNKPDRLTASDYYNRDRERSLGLVRNRYNENPELERISTSGRIAANAGRMYGASHAQNQAMTSAAQLNSARAYGDLYGRKNQFDAASRNMEGQMLAQFGNQEAATRFQVQDVNARNKAQKYNHLATAAGQASGMLQRNVIEANQRRSDLLYKAPAAMAVSNSMDQPYKNAIQGTLMDEYNRYMGKNTRRNKRIGR